MLKKLSLIVISSFLLSSCVSMKKRVYIQSGENNSSSVYKIQNHEYRISQQDILYIEVKTLSDETWVSTGSQQAFNTGAGDMMFYLKGYSVDANGDIILPVVGKFAVIGKTLDEVKALVQEKVNIYFKDALVNVKTAGIKINVLGEVRSPGKYTFYQNEVSIFDALSICGDLTDIANRSNIKLLRHDNDVVTVHHIDLTTDQLLASPYYLLQPNDVLYVEPHKAKTWGIGQTGWQTFQTLLATLSSTFLIINFFNN